MMRLNFCSGRIEFAVLTVAICLYGTGIRELQYISIAVSSLIPFLHIAQVDWLERLKFVLGPFVAVLAIWAILLISDQDIIDRYLVWLFCLFIISVGRRNPTDPMSLISDKRNALAFFVISAFILGGAYSFSDFSFDKFSSQFRHFVALVGLVAITNCVLCIFHRQPFFYWFITSVGLAALFPSKSLGFAMIVAFILVAGSRIKVGVPSNFGGHLILASIGFFAVYGAVIFVVDHLDILVRVALLSSIDVFFIPMRNDVVGSFMNFETGRALHNTLVAPMAVFGLILGGFYLWKFLGLNRLSSFNTGVALLIFLIAFAFHDYSRVIPLALWFQLWSSDAGARD